MADQLWPDACEATLPPGIKYILWADDIRLDLPSHDLSLLLDTGRALHKHHNVVLVVAVEPSSLPVLAKSIHELCGAFSDRVITVRVDPLIRGDRDATHDPRMSRPEAYAPGIIPPTKAEAMSPDDVWRVMSKHHHYGSLHAGLMSIPGAADTIAMAIVWTLGSVSSQALQEVLLAMGRDYEAIATSLTQNPFIHNIQGRWEFIDGWREFIAGRGRAEDLISAVEDFCIALACRVARQQCHKSPIPTLGTGRHSFLMPQASTWLLDVLAGIRYFTNQKRQPTRPQRANYAQRLESLVLGRGAARRRHWLPLTIEAYRQTLTLQHLEDGQIAIASGDHPLEASDASLILEAFAAARRWRDRRLADVALHTVMRRPKSADLVGESAIDACCEVASKDTATVFRAGKWRMLPVQIRVLVIAANPSGPRLTIGPESDAIEAALRTSPRRTHFDVRYGVTPTSLGQHVIQLQPTILHIISHGDGDAGLVFHSPDDNRSGHVTGDSLRDLFRALSHLPRLVVINACRSHSQARHLSSVVEFTIGMQGDFGNEAAVDFSKALYKAIASHQSMHNAFSFALEHMRMGGHGKYANMPSLFERDQDSSRSRILLPLE
jgi:hypothetical protein